MLYFKQDNGVIIYHSLFCHYGIIKIASFCWQEDVEKPVIRLGRGYRKIYSASFFLSDLSKRLINEQC
jgi:hypothetical protein